MKGMPFRKAEAAPAFSELPNLSCKLANTDESRCASRRRNSKGAAQGGAGGAGSATPLQPKEPYRATPSPEIPSCASQSSRRNSSRLSQSSRPLQPREPYRATPSPEVPSCASQSSRKRASTVDSSNRSTAPREVGRIAELFDAKGMLVEEAPNCWALVMCQQQPLHQAFDGTAKMTGLSTRQQQMNAQRCLENDQLKIGSRISEKNDEIDRLKGATKGPAFRDKQHLRHVGLLLEPFRDLTTDMVEMFAATCSLDVHDVPQAGNSAKQRWGYLKLVTCAGSSLAAALAKRRASQQEGSQPRVRKYPSSRVVGNALLTNDQRKNLLSVFERYVRRVSGPDGPSDFMRRSTWFKFLHHCGLLGKDGGVPFAQASKVFAFHVEAGVHPPSLDFPGWLQSVRRVLRGPKFFETDCEAFEQLFSCYLKRCDARLAAATAVVAFPPSIGQLRRGQDGRMERSNIKGPAAAIEQPFLPVERFGWLVVAVEEQMCEPEVLQLVHQHEGPLRGMFTFFVDHWEQVSVETDPASRRDTALAMPGQRASTVPGQTLDDDHTPPDSSSVYRGHERAGSWLAGGLADSRLQEFLLRSASFDESVMPGESRRHTTSFDEPAVGIDKRIIGPEDRYMSPECFKAMLFELGIFPQFVQTYSLGQHLVMTCARSESAAFDYETFVECLCRIFFVHLCFYGNSVQQRGSAKCKCLWLLTLLRLRCREHGSRLGLPEELVGTGAEGGQLWITSQEDFMIDSVDLKDVVFWRILDADLQPTQLRPKQGSLRNSSERR